MSTLPDRFNFYCCLNSPLSAREVALLYSALGWKNRKCSWDEYEVLGPWCELVIIPTSSELLISGSVENVPVRFDELLAPLRVKAVTFTAECYDSERRMVRQVKFDAMES